MYPVLISIGPFQLLTANVLTAIGLLVSGYVFWKKGKEEHYSEAQLFDGFLLSMLFGFFVGRLAYIGLHFDQFGRDMLKWLDVVSHPGTQALIGLIGSTLYLARFSIKKKWDTYEILDFWSLAMAINMIFRYMGFFFSGTAFGKQTNLPIGLIFPGVIEKYHPSQLYFVAFYIALYFFLSWSEYRYRTFEWYRAGKKTAQTGFLLSSFIIMSSLFSLVMLFVQMPQLVFWGVGIDAYVYISGFIFGLIMLFKRSGRSFLPAKKKKIVASNVK